MPDSGPKREQQEKARLEKLSAICLALPQAVRENQLSHASFRVSKKVFAYYLNNHHGDGIVSVCCKVLPGDNESLIAANPQKFIMPAYIGPRGWVGLRLDRPTVDWSEVKELVRGSYAQIAPKRLVKLLGRNLNTLRCRFPSEARTVRMVSGLQWSNCAHPSTVLPISHTDPSPRFPRAISHASWPAAPSPSPSV